MSPQVVNRSGGLLRGYWPLAVGVVGAVVMVALAPSRVPIDRAASAERVTTVPEGQTATGWGTSVTPCVDRSRQDPATAYSPPCFEFSGSNGGATAHGVGADAIDVGFRATAEGSVLALFAELSGMPIDEGPEDMLRTAEGLIEYFNEHYQFYGRRLALRSFEGRGQLLDENTGGGQEAATNDALRAADELEVFADVSAQTQPYADALARNGVVAFGAPYMSREWFQERRPYAWSATPDCTTLGEVSTEYANQRLLGRPASFAGGDLRGEARRMAVIAPNNVEYQQCVDSGLRVIADAGNEVALEVEYVLDLSQAAAQASSVAARLRSSEATSVACFCDPLFLASLAAEVESQGLAPEWLVAGVGYTDLDAVGRFIANGAPQQWERAFGTSVSGPLPAAEASEGYRAYRSVRDDEPSVFVEVLYQQLLPLALGVQMAGPNLTPEALETGLLAYPPASGPSGRWDWAPGRYTPATEVRELWWDATAASSFDGAPGAYVDSGERYRSGEIPEGDPEVFR